MPAGVVLPLPLYDLRLPLLTFHTYRLVRSTADYYAWVLPFHTTTAVPCVLLFRLRLRAYSARVYAVHCCMIRSSRFAGCHLQVQRYLLLRYYLRAGSAAQHYLPLHRHIRVAPGYFWRRTPQTCGWFFRFLARVSGSAFRASLYAVTTFCSRVALRRLLYSVSVRAFLHRLPFLRF